MTLSKTTDALDVRLGLGEELGGLLLLSVAGSLPELAITISAAAQGNLGLAAGNLIGGIAMQTMVLVICDIAVGRARPLTFLVGALSPVLEGLLVTLVVSGVLMGALLAPTTAIAGVVSPASIGIVVVWTIGVYVINNVRKSPRWRITMEGSHPGRRHHRDPHPTQPHPFASRSTSAGRLAVRRRVCRHPGGRRGARDEREHACRPGGHQRRRLRRDDPGGSNRPARDQLGHCGGSARRPRARPGRHLRRQRVSALPCSWSPT